MSYEFYKMIHIVSIVIFFSMFASAAYRGTSDKLTKILTGVFVFTIFVSGMGLIARIGIPHGQGWPFWLKAKVGIWLILAASGHMIMKRFPQFAVKTFWIYVGFLTLASYLANYKITM